MKKSNPKKENPVKEKPKPSPAKEAPKMPKQTGKEDRFNETGTVYRDKDGKLWI